MIVRSLTRGLVLPINRSLIGRKLGGDALTIGTKALFASGEKGVMFDFSKASNLYTDSARSTPVTATNDPIGSVTDLSGNGKHASSSSTMRPLWNSAGYATWDAFDDYMQTAAIDFTGTDAVTVVASVRKASDAAIGCVLESSASSNANSGTFGMFAPINAGVDNLTFQANGGTARGAISTGFAAPINLVIGGEADISSDYVRTRVNGTQVAENTTDLGAAASMSSQPLNIGARNAASLFLNGRIYRLLVIGRALTTIERSTAERWAAQPAGVTLA